MPDREKVIEELESIRDICNAKSNMAIGKGKVAWAGYANAADDAISLLKKQEPEEPIRLHHTEHKQTDNYRCQKCGNDLYFEQRFCEACGCEVKWNE